MPNIVATLKFGRGEITLKAVTSSLPVIWLLFCFTSSYSAWVFSIFYVLYLMIRKFRFIDCLGSIRVIFSFITESVIISRTLSLFSVLALIYTFWVLNCIRTSFIISDYSELSFDARSKSIPKSGVSGLFFLPISWHKETSLELATGSIHFSAIFSSFSLSSVGDCFRLAMNWFWYFRPFFLRRC